MNLRDLKYLVAVADHKHFGKAAEHCCVSQPALSMQLKKLEDTLGVALIERGNKGVLLTKVGKIIVERAKNILTLAHDIKKITKDACDPFSGELLMGVIPTFSPYVLPHIIPGLTKALPKISFYLVENQTSHLINALREGTIDAAILACPLAEPDFSVAPLFEEEFVLAVHPTHKFAKRKIIKNADLKDHSLLLLEEGHCMRDQALTFCKIARTAEENQFRATSLETLRHMVAANVGVTLMPKLACKTNDGICYIPFTTPKPVRTACLVWRNTTTKKEVLETIAMQIRKLMAQQNIIKI